MPMIRQGTQAWTNIAVIGPAQHGKSTLAGFVLWSQGEVQDRTMREAQAAVERGDIRRQFSYLLDRRPHERTTLAQPGRSQTQEPSWWGFSSKDGFRFLLMDSPGQFGRVAHVVGVLSEADAALLVIDVHDYITAGDQRGVWRDKDKRLFANVRGQIDAYLSIARFYGVEQLIVAIHKMDRFQFSQQCYEEIEHIIGERLDNMGWPAGSVRYVPTAVDPAEAKGYNVSAPAEAMREWYKGPTLVEALKRARPRPAPVDAEFRMDVNYVFQGKRIHVPGTELVVTGKVLTGRVQRNDHVVFQPSGIQCRVRSIEPIDNSKVVERTGRWLPPGEQSQHSAQAGELIGLGCNIVKYGEHTEVKTGELLGSVRFPPGVGRRLRGRGRIPAQYDLFGLCVSSVRHLWPRIFPNRLPCRKSQSG